MVDTSKFIGGQKYDREERHFLSKMHKYFNILWSSCSIEEGRVPP